MTKKTRNEYIWEAATVALAGLCSIVDETDATIPELAKDALLASKSLVETFEEAGLAPWETSDDDN